jgi:hypothetical protein
MARNVWNRECQAIAVAVPFPGAMEESVMQDRIAAVRDVLIVLALQVVFRVTQLLRQCNY